MACIAGSIAAGFYGTAPAELVAGVRGRPDDRLVSAFDEFDETLKR